MLPAFWTQHKNCDHWSATAPQSREEYNKNVVEVNELIRLFCDNEALNVVYWRHHGFWTDLSFLHNDGTHLEVKIAMPKYFRSVRSAILHADIILGNI